MEDVYWFGHSSFYFVDKNESKIYFIDPLQLRGRAKEKADIIFITHAHPDHFSQNDIEEIIHNETIIVAPPDILEKINIEDSRKIKVEPNKNYEINHARHASQGDAGGNFKFSTVPAYNTNPEKLQFHPKENNWIGYIFELNGKKIYHAGDTDFTEEVKNLKHLNLDVAMLPMDGHFTMDFREAAQAANTIAAKITIPIHYKNQIPNNYQDLEEALRTLVINSKVVILKEEE